MRKRTYAIVAVLVAIILARNCFRFISFKSVQRPVRSSKLKVIATFYPLYDFAQNVGGNKTDVSILVPETVDVHDFEPTPSSIAEICKRKRTDLQRRWSRTMDSRCN